MLETPVRERQSYLFTKCKDSASLICLRSYQLYESSKLHYKSIETEGAVPI